jgi:hypothetical protein
MPLIDQLIYKAKPKAARMPTAKAPVLAMFRPEAAPEAAVAEADELAVDEAWSPPEVEVAVSEASEPEAERVEVEVEEELSEELELEAASSTVFLPQLVDWQTFWPGASSGWAAVHWITYCSQTRAGRVCW